MAEREKETAVVVSQEELAEGIFSMWLQTNAAKEAKPGQFISMYTNDGSKLLPRPISICEIDKENGRLRMVYRVTGENTGTEQFSKMKAGDTIPVIGPLGNGFPLEEGTGKKAFLMGGGIGVPPILELAKQLEGEKQIVVGYRNADTFLQKEFEQNGQVYISTEDGSVGTKGNVMDAIRENGLDAEIIYADRHRCFARLKHMRRKETSLAIFRWKREWHVESGRALPVYVRRKRKTTTAMYTTNASAKMDRCS